MSFKKQQIDREFLNTQIGKACGIITSTMDLLAINSYIETFYEDPNTGRGYLLKVERTTKLDHEEL